MWSKLTGKIFLVKSCCSTRLPLFHLTRRLCVEKIEEIWASLEVATFSHFFMNRKNCASYVVLRGGGYHPLISCLVWDIIKCNTAVDSAFISDNNGIFGCNVYDAPRNYLIFNKGIRCDIASAMLTQGCVLRLHPRISCVVSDIISCNTAAHSAFISDNNGIFSCNICECTSKLYNF